MLPVLQLGPLAIQMPGLILLAGLWLGLTLAEKHAARRGVSANDLYNLVFVALVAGLIGARLTYVLRFPAAFAASPASALSLNPGLLDPFGGAVAACLAGMIFAQRKNLALWPTLDALTPLATVVALALALAHLAAGSAFGAPADLPWSIDLWGARRHPTQIYEALLAAAGLWLFRPGAPRWLRSPAGAYTLTFLAYSATARLFVEAFRGDSVLLPGGLRAAQIVAWMILAACLWGLPRLKNAPTDEDEPAPVT